MWNTVHYQPATAAPNLRPQKLEPGLSAEWDPSSDIPWKVWLRLSWLLNAASLKWKPLENMFSYKMYKEICCGAHSWKHCASSHSPWSDFLQHFGTSGSAPGGQPEAGEVIKHCPLPGQLWARVLPREGMTNAWRKPGPRAFAALSRRETGTSPEEFLAPCLSQGSASEWQGTLGFWIALTPTKFRSTSHVRGSCCKPKLNLPDSILKQVVASNP